MPPETPHRASIDMADKRNCVIKVRCTEAEFAEIQARSTNRQLAVWVREHCLGAKKMRTRAIPPIDPALLRQLAGMGNNLNQIARALNQQSFQPLQKVQTITILAAIQRELESIKTTHTGEVSDDS